MMKKEKVLLYGFGNTLKQNIVWISQIYNVVGITGNNVEKNSKWGSYNVYILNDAMNLTYDKIVVTSVFFDDIKIFLMKQFDINPIIIINFLDEWDSERSISFGDKNADVTFLIWRPWWGACNNGFMNLFNDAVRTCFYAKEKNYEFAVDMRNYYTISMRPGELGKVNIWEYYFEQLSQYSLDEIYESKNVILACNNSKADGSPNIFKTKEDVDIRLDEISKISKSVSKYFRWSHGLEINCANEKKRIGFCGNVLGVIARGTDYAHVKPKLHAIPCENKIYINHVRNIMNKYGFDKVFLATEDEEILMLFKKYFDKKELIYTGQRRYSDTKNNYLCTIKLYDEDDSYRKCMDYNVVVALLSQCSGLLSNCYCGSVDGAILQNKNTYRYLEVMYSGIYN